MPLNIEQLLPIKFQISELILPLGQRELQLQNEPPDKNGRNGKELWGHVTLNLKTRTDKTLLLDSLYRDPPHPSWLIWQRYKAPQPRPWSEASRHLARLGFDSGTIEATRLVLTDETPGRFIMGTAPIYAGILQTFETPLRFALFTRTTDGYGYIVEAVWIAPTTNALPEIQWLREENEGKWWWPELRQPTVGFSTAATAKNLDSVKKMITTIDFDPAIIDLLNGKYQNGA